MLKFLLFFISFAALADVNTIIEEEAAKNRYISSGASLIFGGLTLYQGLGIKRDPKLYTDRAFGDALIGIGAIRLVDAFQGLWSPSRLEVEYAKRRGNQARVNALVREEYEFGRRRRWFRATMVGLTALIHTHLVLTGKSDYRVMEHSALFLSTISIFKFWYLSPEEQAYNELEKKISFFATPQSVGFSYRF
jgi:hypothetical protein